MRRFATFVAREIIPIALEYDRLGTMPLDAYAKFCEQGISEPFFRGNGTPQGPYLVTFCLAGEHLGYGCGAVASLITLSTFLNRLVLTLLAEPGTAVLPTCSIDVTRDTSAVRRRTRLRSNSAGQVESHS